MTEDIAELEARMRDPEAWGDAVEPPRRRKSEQRQRAALICVRVNETELAALQAYAQDQGASLSGALREAGLRAAGGQP